MSKLARSRAGAPRRGEHAPRVAAGRPLTRLLLTLAGLLVLAGCGVVPPDHHDAGIDKDRGDFNELLDAPDRGQPDAETDGAGQADGRARATRRDVPAVPRLAPVAPEPEVPELMPNPRVSISATEDVSLKDILFELARQAGVEIEIDPRIAGGIIFSVRNRPFLEVIKRISRLAGLRYSVDDNVVRVEVDTPYQVDYEIPYITQARETASRVAISTELSTPGVDDGGGSGDTSSSSVVTGQATSDFFTQLENALQAIVANNAPRGLAQPGEGDSRRDSVSILAQAGSVSVFGTSQQHKAVKRYLEKLRRAISAQVLIEAKVVEVNLSRRFESGIDWSAVLGDLSAAATFGETATPAELLTGSTEAARDLVSFSVADDDFSALLSLIDSFGTTRTLSSPRMTVMNNQTAILKVAENEVFFEIDVEEEEEEDVVGDTTTLTIDSEIRTVPVGLVMAVQPAIDLRRNRVTLTLRPTVTRIDRFVNDPAVSIVSNNAVESRIPVVETRELDSVLELRSGEVAVLGGLMEERSGNEDDGVPGLSRIPWLGRAFKSRQETTEMVELVVLLRARILRGARRTVEPADRRVYEDFTRDPRPLPLPDVAPPPSEGG